MSLFNVRTGMYLHMDISGVNGVEELEMNIKASHSKDKVIGTGEVVTPGKPGVRTYSMSLVLSPQSQLAPIDILDFFMEARDNCDVLRMFIERKDMRGKKIYNTTLQILLGDYKVTERGGEVGTMFLDMEIIEYRPIEVKVLE